MAPRAAFDRFPSDPDGGDRLLDDLLRDLVNAISVQVRWHWARRPGTGANLPDDASFTGQIVEAFESVDRLDLTLRRLFDRLLRAFYFTQHQPMTDRWFNPTTRTFEPTWLPAVAMWYFDGQWRTQQQARRYLPAFVPSVGEPKPAVHVRRIAEAVGDLPAVTVTEYDEPKFDFGFPDNYGQLVGAAAETFKSSLDPGDVDRLANGQRSKQLLPREHTARLLAGAIYSIFEVIWACDTGEHLLIAQALGELRTFQPKIAFLTMEYARANHMSYTQIANLLPRKANGLPLTAMGASKVFANSVTPELLTSLWPTEPYTVDEFRMFIDQAALWTIEMQDLFDLERRPLGEPIPASVVPADMRFLFQLFDDAEGAVHICDGGSQRNRHELEAMCGLYWAVDDDTPQAAGLFAYVEVTELPDGVDRRCPGCLARLAQRRSYAWA